MKERYTKRVAKELAEHFGRCQVRCRVVHGKRVIKDDDRRLQAEGETWEGAVVCYATAVRQYDAEHDPLAEKEPLLRRIKRLWRSVKLALVVGLGRLKP